VVAHLLERTVAEDLIAQVKQANDIVEVVREYLPLRRQGRTYKGLCPFHDDHHPSLDVDPVRQRFRCWACGKYGDVITFVQERERCSFREAVEMLARRAGITPRWGNPQRDQERNAWYELMRWAEEQYRRFLWESPRAQVARNTCRPAVCKRKRCWSSHRFCPAGMGLVGTTGLACRLDDGTVGDSWAVWTTGVRWCAV
jgi:hypothetical protein